MKKLPILFREFVVIAGVVMVISSSMAYAADGGRGGNGGTGTSGNGGNGHNGGGWRARWGWRVSSPKSFIGMLDFETIRSERIGRITLSSWAHLIAPSASCLRSASSLSIAVGASHMQ